MPFHPSSHPKLCAYLAVGSTFWWRLWWQLLPQWTRSIQPMQFNSAWCPTTVCWQDPHDTIQQWSGYPICPGWHAACAAANPRYSNVTKQWANQNVCFSCRFDVEDWHTSAMCPRKKMGHMDEFTRSNYMEYKRDNHQFCCKAMHKTMYPQM
jgi:hypothetical protein